MFCRFPVQLLQQDNIQHYHIIHLFINLQLDTHVVKVFGFKEARVLSQLTAIYPGCMFTSYVYEMFIKACR